MPGEAKRAQGGAGTHTRSFSGSGAASGKAVCPMQAPASDARGAWAANAAGGPITAHRRYCPRLQGRRKLARKPQSRVVLQRLRRQERRYASLPVSQAFPSLSSCWLLAWLTTLSGDRVPSPRSPGRCGQFRHSRGRARETTCYRWRLRDLHTSTGGTPFAGGRPIPTPFGTIHSTNITPDPETGIGRWSQAAFQRSLREGRRPTSLSRLSLYPFHQADGQGHLRNLRIPDVARTGGVRASAKRAFLSGELQTISGCLEASLAPAWRLRTRCRPERQLESRRLPGPGTWPLFGMPFPVQIALAPGAAARNVAAPLPEASQKLRDRCRSAADFL